VTEAFSTPAGDISVSAHSRLRRRVAHLTFAARWVFPRFVPTHLRGIINPCSLRPHPSRAAPAAP
jgi:hypothetical protein